MSAHKTPDRSRSVEAACKARGFLTSEEEMNAASPVASHPLQSLRRQGAAPGVPPRSAPRAGVRIDAKVLAWGIDRVGELASARLGPCGRVPCHCGFLSTAPRPTYRARPTPSRGVGTNGIGA